MYEDVGLRMEEFMELPLPAYFALRYYSQCATSSYSPQSTLITLSFFLRSQNVVEERSSSGVQHTAIFPRREVWLRNAFKKDS
jgi:hypothetical protein